MKPIHHIVLTSSLFCAFSLGLVSQTTRTEAVAGMRKVEAREMDPAYTSPAPFAQKLVDEALAKHPEVILLAIHATPPGHRNVIIASNFGRIGKLGDEDDMRCIHTGKPNLEVPPKGDRFEVEFALKDRSNKTIGAVGVVFNYKAGDDKSSLEDIANSIGSEMRAQLPDASALFKRS
ncbi:hypothetical protein [Edaphobacter sp.]|uniref:hypothetical protein n=1 Tax=Edaphobacter sp. TaxID=1934404 RepID=UPI002DBD4746|nr:hypothetical protein [Edaphobacter sp.]HEU5340552.1 hypothetical protein [Edaphobacter sp.]